jgi:hypothetical protein
MGWFNTGCEVHAQITTTGRLLLLTAVPYLIIQASAFTSRCGTKSETTAGSSACVRTNEHLPALIGLVYCVLAFIGYLWFQTQNQDSNEVADAKKVDAFMGAGVSIRVALKDLQGKQDQTYVSDRSLCALGVDRRVHAASVLSGLGSRMRMATTVQVFP